MPRYQVVVRETNTYYAEIDAATAESAVEKINLLIGVADQFTDVCGSDRPTSSDLQVLEPEEIV